MTISPPAAPLVGVQEPRFHSVPAAELWVAGQDAIDLAHRAGLHLDPWQQLVLRDALGQRADGRWAAQKVGLIVPRQNGKGAVLEALELAKLFLFGSRLILHTAHEVKTAKNHYERMQALIRGAPFLSKRVKQWRNSNEEISIELHNGAKLRFIARSTGSGRGFSATDLILDEAMILNPEGLSALGFTLGAAPDAQTWYAGSAGFETSALLARLREDGISGSDPGLAYFEWSVEDDADLDDEIAVAVSNPAYGIRLRRESVAVERSSLPELQYARERLGIWAPTGGDPVIQAKAWGAVVDAGSVLCEPAALALDVNPERSISSIGAASRRPDGLDHVEVLENRAGVAWVVERLVNLCRDRRIIGVVVDPASPAGAMRPALEARGVPVVETTAREYAQACGVFFDAVVEKQVRHRGQELLAAAVDAGRKRQLGDAWAWHRRNAKSDITPLVTVTLALSLIRREKPKTLARATGRASTY